MKELKPSGNLNVGKARGMTIVLGLVGCSMIAAIAVVGFALVSVTNSFMDDLPVVGDMGFCIFPVLLLVMIGGGIAAYQIGFRQARRLKLDTPGATLSVDTLGPGQSFTFTYDQKVNSATEVRAIAIDLVLRETAQYRSGTDTVTVTHDHIIDHKALPGRNYNPGSRLMESVSMQIPDDAIHSWGVAALNISHESDDLEHELMQLGTAPTKAREMAEKIRQSPAGLRKMVLNSLISAARNNTLRWYITTKVDVAGWLNYLEEFEIEVEPVALTAEDGESIW